MQLQRDASWLAERACERRIRNPVIRWRVRDLLYKTVGLCDLVVRFAVRLMCSSIDLVICDILVPHRIKDITYDDRLYVVEQHVEPHRDDGNGKTVSYEEDRLVLQGVSDRDGGDGKTRVGEDHRPPAQMEVDSPGVNHLANSAISQ